MLTGPQVCASLFLWLCWTWLLTSSHHRLHCTHIQTTHKSQILCWCSCISYPVWINHFSCSLLMYNQIYCGSCSQSVWSLLRLKVCVYVCVGSSGLVVCVYVCVQGNNIPQYYHNDDKCSSECPHDLQRAACQRSLMRRAESPAGLSEYFTVFFLGQQQKKRTTGRKSRAGGGTQAEINQLTDADTVNKFRRIGN